MLSFPSLVRIFETGPLKWQMKKYYVGPNLNGLFSKVGDDYWLLSAQWGLWRNQHRWELVWFLCPIHQSLLSVQLFLIPWVMLCNGQVRFKKVLHFNDELQFVKWCSSCIMYRWLFVHLRMISEDDILKLLHCLCRQVTLRSSGTSTVNVRKRGKDDFVQIQVSPDENQPLHMNCVGPLGSDLKYLHL